MTRQDPARGAWAAEARATLALAWPIVLTNLAQVAIPTTEVILLGHLGPEALAAGTLGANCFFALFVSGLGLALATAPMMAQALGARRHAVRDVRLTVRQGAWAALGFCLPAWAVLWRAEDFLLTLGQDPALAHAAGQYVRALQWGLLPALWFVVMRSFISALERPRSGLVVTLAGIAVNAVVCWALAFGRLGMPALGLTGAGIAGSLSYTVMAVMMLGWLLHERRFRRYALLGHWWRIEWPHMRELLRIGLPMAVTMGFEVTTFNAAVFLMGLIGTSSLAAHSVAIQVATVTFMVPMGLSQAATVRVGLAAGANDAAAVTRAGWTAFAIGEGFMACSALVLLLAPGLVTGLFLGDEAAEVATLAVAFLGVAGVFQLADGAQAVMAGALRGLKDTQLPMLFAGLGYWGIGLPLGAALAFLTPLKGVGVWIGLATGLATVAALMLWRWLRREKLRLIER